MIVSTHLTDVTLVKEGKEGEEDQDDEDQDDEDQDDKINPRHPKKLAPSMCFQSLVGCLKPTTAVSETLIKDPHRNFKVSLAV